jgi:hypothetical protein
VNKVAPTKNKNKGNDKGIKLSFDTYHQGLVID